MKGFSKNKRGISLIVLVITIIVMIILATAIILSLNGSGIIGRANEAVEKSDMANAKNVMSLAYAEWELGEGELKDTYSSFAEYAKAKLEEAGFDTENIYVTDNGELFTGPAAVIVSNNVPLGTTVTGYDLSSNKNKTYTTEGTENTGDLNLSVTIDPQPRTLTRVDDLSWKYIGMDEAGNVLIAADVASNMPTVMLTGFGGYVNGPSVLNKACDVLYSTDMGTARNMNIDDVTNLLQLSGIKYKSYYYEEYEYDDANGNAVVGKNFFEEEVDEALTVEEISKKIDTTISNGYNPDGIDINTKKIDYYTVKSDSEYIKSDETAKSLVYQSTSYWLSSLTHDVMYNNYSYWYYMVRYINNSVLDANAVCTFADGSWFVDYGETYAIRPVIALSSNVNATFENGVLKLN